MIDVNVMKSCVAFTTGFGELGQVLLTGRAGLLNKQELALLSVTRLLHGNSVKLHALIAKPCVPPCMNLHRHALFMSISMILGSE